MSENTGVKDASLELSVDQLRELLEDLKNRADRTAIGYTEAFGRLWLANDPTAILERMFKPIIVGGSRQQTVEKELLKVLDERLPSMVKAVCKHFDRLEPIVTFSPSALYPRLFDIFVEEDGKPVPIMNVDMFGRRTETYEHYERDKVNRIAGRWRDYFVRIGYSNTDRLWQEVAHRYEY